MGHEGHCFRNAKYSAKAGEEKEAPKVGRDLLLDKDGKPRMNGIFMQDITGDMDTRGPNKTIAAQQQIIGPAVLNLARHLPDEGHLSKGLGNELWGITKEDSSFKSVHCLSAIRIKSIQSDVKGVVRSYTPHVGDPLERQKCLKQLRAVVRHHCGDHSLCTHENGFCSFKTLEHNNQECTPEELKEKFKKKHNRFRTCMDLNENGILRVEKAILHRYSEESIDRIAQCSSDNCCEGFWSVLVKLSEGKRIFGVGTDLWESMVELCFCFYGGDNVERTKVRLREILGLELNPVTERYLEQSKRKRKRDYERQNGPIGKKRREQAVLTVKQRQGLDPDKKSFHKTEKAITKSKGKSKPTKCTNCKLTGHTAKMCPAVRAPKKRKANLLDFGGVILPEEKFQPKLKRHQVKIIDWSTSSIFN